MHDRPPTLLLVEDNEEDAFLLRRALQKGGVKCSLQHASEGEEAIDYLSGRGNFADRCAHPMPVIVLLDLKLPYLNGFDVLAWAATQAQCRDTTFIILTSSGEDFDRAQASRHGVRHYFVKPPGPELVGLVKRTLQEFAGARPR